MKNSTWKQLLTEIHSSGRRCVLAITGGGGQAIGKLLSTPGGSNSLLEAVVPYSLSALTEFLGGEPDQACSEPTARAMAMAAWMRAKVLAPAADPHMLVGIGTTASLVSNSHKRGEHRIHVALQTANQTTSLSLKLVKAKRTRQQEERLAAKLLLVALGEACGANTAACRHSLEQRLMQGEQILRRHQEAESKWTELLLGEQSFVQWPRGVSEQLPSAIFPGAFHPLHQGHRRMAEIAAKLTESEVVYELSITNVDKPPLDFVEIADRLAGIEKNDPGSRVLLTTASTFIKKAALLAGCTFVVGVDTLQRIADPRYYGNDQIKRDSAIHQIATADCHFLVFGRQVDGKFCSLGDLQLPNDLLRLCTEVLASEFREDVSSTELRRDP